MQNRNHHQKTEKPNEGTPSGKGEGQDKEWAIVEGNNPSEGHIVAEFETHEDAENAFEKWYPEGEAEMLNAKIMRRNENGYLTTEF